jgi:transposase
MYYIINIIKMSMASSRRLQRAQIGGLPLIHAIMRALQLPQIFADHLPGSSSRAITTADTLRLLVVNLTIAKDPLYQLQHWVDSLDLRCVGFQQRPAGRFSDDRFARALDQLYAADRSSLMTSLVVSAVHRLDLDLSRIHTDNTTIKTYGDMPGQTPSGVEFRHGYSKDHRPDLKQLVFSLSICADGAVPVHHHVYSGNRNEETTHIETWETLRRIHGRADFLYVADCKLCTQSQLRHLVEHGGRAITILPHNFTEVRDFHQRLRIAPPVQKRLWRRDQPNDESQSEWFYLLEGTYRTKHGGYPLYWFVSSEKRKRDRTSRQERLEAAEQALRAIGLKVNGHGFKRHERIRHAVDSALNKYRVGPFFKFEIPRDAKPRSGGHRHMRRRGQGRKYQTGWQVSYRLNWSRRTEALRQEKRTDGVFPLLCTDPSLSPKSVLQAYKYQPRLEKRFAQLKSVHRVAPLLFKRVDRVEANLFVFFVALMIQALLERQLRQRIEQRGGGALKLYPEDRDAPHPTTSQLLKTFEGLSTYAIVEGEKRIEQYRDELNATQKAVLKLLDIEEKDFWESS